MSGYLARRALHSAIALLGLVVAVFFLARLTGDPTNLFLPIDASLETRKEFANETTVARQIAENVHLQGDGERDFVAFRQCRDQALAAPRLLYPAVQFNMRGGAFAPPESNGRTYVKIPVRL